MALALPLAPVLLLIFTVHFFIQTDPDYWWHVRVGQYIFETGGLPRADIFSYTAAGSPWITHEWLTELLFFVVQQYFGYVGNVALFATAGALTWYLVHKTCQLRRVGEPAATLLVLWGFAMAAPSAGTRPQTITGLLLAVSVLLLTRYKQGEQRAVWLLPPLFAAWVNLHGGYIIGLVLLGLAVVGESIAQIRHRVSAPMVPLLGASVLSAAATLVNPHGVDALLYPFSYAGSANGSMRYIEEWQSPNFHQATALVFAAGLLAILLLGVVRRPLLYTEALWILLLALMGLQSSRHIPLFALVVMPLIGARLRVEAPPGLAVLAVRWRQKLVLAATAAVAVCLVVIANIGLQDPARLQIGREPANATFPAGGVEYLRASTERGHLFNQYGWGGYVIYQLYPDWRVSIDGRADVYGDALMDRHMAVEQLKPKWRHILAEDDVQFVLVGKATPLASALSGEPGWRESYEGEVERLFERTSGEVDVAISQAGG